MTTQRMKSSMRSYIALFVFAIFMLGVMTFGTTSIKTIKDSEVNAEVNYAVYHDEDVDELPDFKEMIHIEPPSKAKIMFRM